MAFSFDANLTEPKDVVRSKIFDTDANCFVFSDETIEAYLTRLNGNVYCAAAELCQARSLQLALQPSTQSEHEVLDRAAQSRYFRQLADDYANTCRQVQADTMYFPSTVMPTKLTW